jgi:hypothetical protein
MPQNDHALIPEDHRILRPRFLAASIPMPDDADREHDERVARLIALVPGRTAGRGQT